MQKVKEQIAQDRAEKTERFNREKNERDEKRKELEKEKLVEEARKAEQLLRERRFVLKLLIQFRKADKNGKNIFLDNYSPKPTL